MTCNTCIQTYLVSSVTVNTTTGTAVLTFSTTPTMENGKCFKFRVPCNITTVVTANTPITANVNINGTVTAVPVWNCLGNVLRTGDLKTRKCYLAQFGNDPNHLLTREVKNV